MIRRAIASTLVLAVLAVGLVAPATAAPPARTTLPAIEKEVMCTVCGVPLEEAGEAPFATRERDFINVRIARGETKEQIKRELVVQYGNDVLALPKARGFALAAYLVPVLAVLAGVLTLALLAPRWRRRARPGPAPAGTPDAREAMNPVDARRLDEELARFER